MDLSQEVQSEPARTPVAARNASRTAILLLAGFAALKLAIHFAVTLLTPYEIHRDEFLYLAMGEHLRFWAMDFPPFIAVLAKAARWIFGDTLFAVRFFPAVGGTLLVLLTGLLARQFGGGRAAQALAMLTTLCVPLFMRPAALFQPVIWDQLWWTLGFYALTLVGRGQMRAGWVLFGLACGLGLLTKFSILFFGLGVLVALLLSRRRSEFLTPWPWVAAGLTLLIGSATLVGQIRLRFPVLLHMSDLQSQQLARVTYAEFVGGQLWMLGPAFLLAVAGCVWLLRSRSARPFRNLGTAAVVCFLLLMVLRGKAYYIGPIYPTLFAAGAVALFSLAGRVGAWSRGLTTALIVLFGLGSLPFGLPILPPQTMARYAAGAGMKAAVTTNRGTVLPLPQDYADMLGWEDEVRSVARVWQTLPQRNREQAGFIARNYGQAGALEFYGGKYGLPPRIMLPDNIQLWPPDDTRQSVVTIGISASDLEQFFKRVRVVETFDHPWMVEEERNLTICVAEEPLKPVSTAWKIRFGISK